MEQHVLHYVNKYGKIVLEIKVKSVINKDKGRNKQRKRKFKIRVKEVKNKSKESNEER